MPRIANSLKSPCARLMGAAAMTLASASTSTADEGGASFWLPGQYSSFAAVAPEQGFSMPLMTYSYSAAAKADQKISTGQDIRLDLDTRYLGQFIIPTYTPDMELWGAQPSFSMAVILAGTDLDAGASIGSLSGSASDSMNGIGDLFPTAQLFWNEGVHNYMAYIAGSIPVGNYDPDRLVNTGLGHAAVDFGGAYTYFNPQSGWEFSATGGVTFNFKNYDTDYTNGTSLHLDLATSYFVSETTHVGLVGYAYKQITADSGQPEILGDFKSEVYGLGPQIGMFFGDDARPSYISLRGYWEFGAKNRVEGNSAMLTLSVPF